MRTGNPAVDCLGSNEAANRDYTASLLRLLVWSSTCFFCSWSAQTLLVLLPAAHPKRSARVKRAFCVAVELITAELEKVSEACIRARAAMPFWMIHDDSTRLGQRTATSVVDRTQGDLSGN